MQYMALFHARQVGDLSQSSHFLPLHAWDSCAFSGGSPSVTGPDHLGKPHLAFCGRNVFTRAIYTLVWGRNETRAIS